MKKNSSIAKTVLTSAAAWVVVVMVSFSFGCNATQAGTVGLVAATITFLLMAGRK